MLFSREDFSTFPHAACLGKRTCFIVPSTGGQYVTVCVPPEPTTPALAKGNVHWQMRQHYSLGMPRVINIASIVRKEALSINMISDLCGKGLPFNKSRIVFCLWLRSLFQLRQLKHQYQDKPIMLTFRRGCFCQMSFLTSHTFIFSKLTHSLSSQSMTDCSGQRISQRLL